MVWLPGNTAMLPVGSNALKEGQRLRSLQRRNDRNLPQKKQIPPGNVQPSCFLLLIRGPQNTLVVYFYNFAYVYVYHLQGNDVAQGEGKEKKNIPD